MQQSCALCGQFNHSPILIAITTKSSRKIGWCMGEKRNYVGNGAYKLANHIINEKIEFERNPLYWNDKETVINSATFLAIENLVPMWRVIVQAI